MNDIEKKLFHDLGEEKEVPTNVRTVIKESIESVKVKKKKYSFFKIALTTCACLILVIGIVYAGTKTYSVIKKEHKKVAEIEKNEEKTHSIYNNIEEQKKDTENIIQSNIITEEDAIKKAKNILEEYGFKNEEIKTIEFENNIESDMALWKVKTESNIYIEFDARGGDYFNIDISNNTYWLKYVNKYDLIYVRDVRRKIL